VPFPRHQVPIGVAVVEAVVTYKHIAFTIEAEIEADTYAGVVVGETNTY
jgi:hypothetical protein